MGKRFDVDEGNRRVIQGINKLRSDVVPDCRRFIVRPLFNFNDGVCF
jgi:hypothetical protein